MTNIRLIVEERDGRSRIQEELSRHGYSVSVGWGKAEVLPHDITSAILIVDSAEWVELMSPPMPRALEDFAGAVILADEAFLLDNAANSNRLPIIVEIVRKPAPSEEILFRLDWLSQRIAAVRSCTAQSKRARECYFQNLLESAPIGILVIDAEGNILELNSKLLEIVGSPSKRVTKSRNVLTYRPLIDGGFSRDVSECLETGRSITNEKPYRSRWEKEIVLRYHMNRVDVGDQAGPQVQVIVENVTEIRRMERQLLQAQNLRSLETLSGGIAHEFNNILQVISGNAELMAQEAYLRGNEVRREIVEIQTAAGRAADLTKGLLAFAADMSLGLRPTDINAEAAACMTLFREALPHGLAVDLEPAESLPPVLVDRIRFRQMLLNLTTNAIDATEDTPRITISTSRYSASVPYRRISDGGPANLFVRLSFRDHGEGIYPEDIQNVFDPFFSTRPVGNRHGIGLSIVYGIMESHGGYATCRSFPRQGTIVDLYFPAIADDAGHGLAGGDTDRGSHTVIKKNYNLPELNEAVAKAMSKQR